VTDLPIDGNAGVGVRHEALMDPTTSSDLKWAVRKEGTMCEPMEWVHLIRRAGVPVWTLSNGAVDVLEPLGSDTEPADGPWHDLIGSAVRAELAPVQAWVAGAGDPADSHLVRDPSSGATLELIRGPSRDGVHFGVARRPEPATSGKQEFQRDALAAMIAAATKGMQLAVTLVGIRGFDLVREGGGYLIADGVFEDVARRLAHASGRSRVYRLDSECLAILLPIDADGDARDGARLAAIVDQVFAAPIEIDGRRHVLAGRAGFGVFPSDAGTLDDLLRIASLALTAAMRATDVAVERGDPAALDRSQQDMLLAAEIADGIASRQFAFELQPIVDLRSMTVVSAEALARWQHPELGRIPPDRFVSLAERQDLMIDCTIAMLRRLGRELPAGGLGPTKIAINVSPGDFGWKKINRLINAVHGEGLLPLDHLVVEITETGMMQATDAEAIRIANALRARGAGVAIDDFGTGYSSFGSLNRLPIDILKIDRSLVQDVHLKPDRQRLLAAIANMAQLLNLTTVVEGLECLDEVATVRAIGCDRVQGYVFSRPLSAGRFFDCAASGMGTPSFG
jgi:predicted signal transduction protein with EAL and GGDEF domain